MSPPRGIRHKLDDQDFPAYTSPPTHRPPRTHHPPTRQQTSIPRLTTTRTAGPGGDVGQPPATDTYHGKYSFG
ncbi:MAG: hypothetical protein LC721_13160 [Actinobacteria bacterium]|nr:hypothetical protein [Actinomycetota bacterium]